MEEFESHLGRLPARCARTATPWVLLGSSGNSSSWGADNKDDDKDDDDHPQAPNDADRVVGGMVQIPIDSN